MATTRSQRKLRSAPRRPPASSRAPVSTRSTIRSSRSTAGARLTVGTSSSAASGSSSATTRSKRVANGSIRLTTGSSRSTTGARLTAATSSRTTFGRSSVTTRSKCVANGSIRSTTGSSRSTDGARSTASIASSAASGSSSATTRSKCVANGSIRSTTGFSRSTDGARSTASIASSAASGSSSVTTRSKCVANGSIRSTTGSSRSTDGARSTTSTASSAASGSSSVTTRSKCVANGSSRSTTKIPESAASESATATIVSIVPCNGKEQRAAKRNATVMMSPKMLVAGRNESVNTVQADQSAIVMAIPESMKEAIDAQLNGTFFLKHDIKQVPTRKYSENDLDKITHKTAYTVQAVYKKPNDSWLVYYEGWTCTTMTVESEEYVSQQFKQAKEEALTRVEFMTKVLQKKNDKNGKNWKIPDPAALKENPEALFWLFEDLSYAHTLLNGQFGLPLMWYLNMSGRICNPPKYILVPELVVTDSIRTLCAANQVNEHIKKMNKWKRLSSEKLTTSCISRTCVCNRRASRLFPGDVQSLEYGADGKLIFPLEYNQQGRRVVVECSDACGCSNDCPRRVLQRKPVVPLCIMYVVGMRYTLRTMKSLRKGDLIVEYTGQLLLFKEKERRRTSYDVRMSVISDMVIAAHNQGNSSRFISHSCDPSACFVEIFSRAYESEVLIPRVAVYALRDMEMGDEITVSYFTEAADDDDHDAVACLCGEANCFKRMPSGKNIELDKSLNNDAIGWDEMGLDGWLNA
ncbi:unnamed protein product [Caenorhabditis sp. 36 PRJEB53466]|nr:unnamed protein product [Caenorhabditis sp. 36 PRJEB53466]